MNRSFKRRLAACSLLLASSSVAFAQNDDPILPCDADCQEACELAACADIEAARDCPAQAGWATYELCNSELEEVIGFVRTVYDGECGIVRQGTTATRMCTPNLAVAAILSQLDIDGDGIADNAPDTDGDGLPDNWESSGVEALTAQGDTTDRVVFFPAPSAIVPGTPPTPIFTRRGVATDALDPDSDGDLLSDYVEVFGLVFIDEINRDGLLDSNEWNDLNGDGLPSPGEHPIDLDGAGILHDFDGFVFTDPTNPDTDGDGKKDGEDNDPLINPRAFGNSGDILVRLNAEGNADIDKDGLGNGMDMGNDLTSEDGTDVPDYQVIDNPASVVDLLRLFREDLLAEGIVPESAIEELLGADWDGNGLWNTTDVRNWSIVIADTDEADSTPPDEFFSVGGHLLYFPQTFAQLEGLVNDPGYQVYAGTLPGVQGDELSRIGMGWQDLLRPASSETSEFIPDKRIWAILYAWRMPGFDIDGDGFVGGPNIPSAVSRICPDAEGNDQECASAALEWDSTDQRFELTNEVLITSTSAQPFDDRIEIGDPEAATGDEPQLDGVIEPSFGICGLLSFGMIFLMALGIAVPKFIRRR
ncbi:MAG: hypothetical protein JSU63_11670 [Phycisphaerales bacterium]|nr:MAG: hypothetical protein JSU63_11670 [Phycisphaerales bacterium]